MTTVRKVTSNVEDRPFKISSVEVKRTLLQLFREELRRIQRDRKDLNDAINALTKAVRQVGEVQIAWLRRSKHDFKLFVRLAVNVPGEYWIDGFTRTHVDQALNIFQNKEDGGDKTDLRPNRYTPLLNPLGLHFREDVDSFSSIVGGEVKGPPLSTSRNYTIVSISFGRAEIYPGGELVRFNRKDRKYLFFDEGRIKLDIKNKEYLFLLDGGQKVEGGQAEITPQAASLASTKPMINGLP